MPDGTTTGRTGSLFGVAGVIMALCCLAGPAVLGAIAGAAIGSWFGIVAAVAVALSAAALLRHRRANKKGC
jgi:flagellar motor component MotA